MQSKPARGTPGDASAFVASWLENEGLERYVAAFVRAGFDTERACASLESEEYLEMIEKRAGVDILPGHKRHVLRAAEELRKRRGELELPVASVRGEDAVQPHVAVPRRDAWCQTTDVLQAHERACQTELSGLDVKALETAAELRVPVDDLRTDTPHVAKSVHSVQPPAVAHVPGRGEAARVDTRVTAVTQASREVVELVGEKVRARIALLTGSPASSSSAKSNETVQPSGAVKSRRSEEEQEALRVLKCRRAAVAMREQRRTIKERIERHLADA